MVYGTCYIPGMSDCRHSGTEGCKRVATAKGQTTLGTFFGFVLSTGGL